jgi:[NiFe] hydrogenase diaphorase moiety small subunit
VSETITITIDGIAVQAERGQSIMAAADAAGIYIPRLCALKGLSPFGACRVCTVIVDGGAQAACTEPARDGAVIENDTPKLLAVRRAIVEMLFVEGSHCCAVCEKSGNCELQALAYRLGIVAPQYPLLFPERRLDASHPDIFIDRSRCILCARCVRASQERDGKHVFDFVGSGAQKRLAVDAEDGLAGTDAAVTDKSIQSCPVGALLRKGRGFAVPIGQRLYDARPIGSDIEAKRNRSKE